MTLKEEVIAHWKENLQATKNREYSKINIDGYYCAFCKIYNHCCECPIYIRTGKIYCKGTVWPKIANAYYSFDYIKLEKLIVEFIKFLESL
jgi:hypothetical protein